MVGANESMVSIGKRITAEHLVKRRQQWDEESRHWTAMVERDFGFKFGDKPATITIKVWPPKW